MVDWVSRLSSLATAGDCALTRLPGVGMTNNASQPNYLTTLLQLGQTLNSSLDLSQVLHIAIDKVVEFVHAERGFILLVEEGTHRVWGKATREIDPQQLEAVLSGRD